MTGDAMTLRLPTLHEVRAVLAAVLPQTGWLPPLGPFRVLDRLSPAHANPDQDRAFEGDDRARAYLLRQVARSDWSRWRELDGASGGPLAAAPWPWTLGGALDRSLVLDAYPVRSGAPVVMVEVPLISFDRAEVLLRAQTHGPGEVEDHERRYVRGEEAAWTRVT